MPAKAPHYEGDINSPEELDTPARRALYNNLGKDKDLALKLDESIHRNRPDGWRSVQTRENVMKKAIHDVLKNFDEVERVFLIVKQQWDY